jgi:DNA/RNA endonuclease YhcR with UshA esterase domain
MAALIAALAIPTAFAQMGQGMGMGAYNPSSVTTVKGVVQDVQEGAMHEGQKGRMGGMGTHLVIKTDKETLTVMVGPSRYLAQKNFSFAKGDQIEVTGSKVKYGGSDAIIAREIKKGDKMLTLRDEKGIPEWSMGRQP